jgi:hypothetical protein
MTASADPAGALPKARSLGKDRFLMALLCRYAPWRKPNQYSNFQSPIAFDSFDGTDWNFL